MPDLRMILDDAAVAEFLTEHGLEEGYVPLRALLLQRDGTTSGKPCMLIAFELEDGEMVVGKTTLALLDVAINTFRAALQVPLEHDREQPDD